MSWNRLRSLTFRTAGHRMLGIGRGHTKERTAQISFLNVTIKTGFSSSAPVGGLVVVGPRTRTQETEEHVPRWSDNNPHMPMPNNQIASLRVKNAAKTHQAVIEIIGARV